MDRNTKILIAKFSIILAVPLILMARRLGAPAGSSGVPGERTCSSCHVGPDPSAGGKVELSFSGGQNYTPGVPQTLTVTVTEPAARLYGFQATARKMSNLREVAGTFSGPGLLNLCDSPDLTRETPKPASGCTAERPLEFIGHAEASSANTFTFTWTPPSSDVGEVRIYVAANAANGNGQETGDRIYTANYTLTPQAAGPKPSIRAADGVANGASFRPGIVSGSWTTIFGTDLAGTTRTWRDDEFVGDRLPTSLDGVSVNINGKPAAVYFISPTQINVQAPTDNAIGPVQVEVIRNGQRSDAVTANLERVSPAFFLFDPEGRKYLAAVNSDGVFLGKPGLFSGLTTRPAAPGGTVLLFGTGFGPTTPAVPAGQVFSGAAALNDPVRITIGGMEATVQFAGLSGAGLYQFNVVVPANLTNGDHAVVTEIGGLRTQENAFITIQGN